MWLQTVLWDSKKALGSDEGREGEPSEGKAIERITLHSVVPYMVLAAAYLCSTLLPAPLSL